MTKAEKKYQDQCEICKEKSGESKFFDLHHIEERSSSKSKNKPVNNHSYNTVGLCPSCHRRCHLGEITNLRWVMTAPEGYKLMCEIMGQTVLC